MCLCLVRRSGSTIAVRRRSHSSNRRVALTMFIWMVGHNSAGLTGCQWARLRGRAQFAPWPKDLLCVLCESLALFAVKFFLTAKLAKNCRQERKAKPHQLKLSLYLRLI